MSSKRNLRRRSCSSKRAFPTAEAAHKAARAAYFNLGENLCVYHCHFSGSHYHIGHAHHPYERKD